MGKAYRGERVVRTHRGGKPHQAECLVWVVGEDGRETPLDPCHDIMDHSPTGLEWGYLGSGPAQLAFALAYHITKDERRAVRVHHPLKQRVVSKFDRHEWTITAEELRSVIADIEDLHYHEDWEGPAEEREEG